LCVNSVFPHGNILQPEAWADWADMAAWHLSNVEVGQTTYPVNREVYGGREEEKGARDKITKRRRRQKGVEQGRGPRDP